MIVLYLKIIICILKTLQCVGEDIEDLEYTPKPEFEGNFKVKNVKDEVIMVYHYIQLKHYFLLLL